MPGFKTHLGSAAVLDRDHVDTDQIIPKQFLKKIDKAGYGEFLFFDWRYHSNGQENEDFELNSPETKEASILVTGKNFGCGSSREHAPWALKDYGFQVIIAESFADIFFNNCVKNGILPIRLSKAEIRNLQSERDGNLVRTLRVDLEQQQVENETGEVFRFEFDPYWKKMLLNGWDEISVTLQQEAFIKKYEDERIVN
ncbi:3-isopropylmalate dehydratase small subunit [Fictibacillus sp. 5RED26]|jgi:3-isopropylmalate/(R)-2-methylmalate dehydratase small subunit|uniref:3-isopropylmalate dehydratase small subunit n=1 Tax=unclassified Fictibacillus TaxID=2644029 RepID=UPI0018CEA3B9|nr:MULTISPECIES: 3-isopropylmalate dehydratase small subunit [unclassified Fictibacillus]MBH0157741.1 3-isopropylmalate dehydratase small subunit [Fictibacillus sp. 5RED26]MBH0175137.1 3-isopropylmalate dehydratase small subunit [Fictibacillus sp. 23RED33]